MQSRVRSSESGFQSLNKTSSVRVRPPLAAILTNPVSSGVAVFLDLMLDAFTFGKNFVVVIVV